MKNLISLGVDYIDSLPLNVSKIKGFKLNKEREIRYRSHYHYWPSDKNPYKIAYRIINNNIGKSYALAFSYYCSKVEQRYQYIFLEYFNESIRRKGKKEWDTNENGIIVYIPYKWKTPKTHIFKSNDYKFELVHYLTGHKIDDFDEIYDKNKPRWNQHKPQYYLYNPNPTRKIPMHKVYKCKITDFVTKVVSGFEIVFESKNDPKFKRLYNERFKLSKKDDRIRKKAEKEKSYNFISKSELELKKQKELDKIKIISHGFDLETSFRNEKQCNPDNIKNKQ